MSSQSTELSTLCWIATCKTNRNWEAALFICSASVLIEHGSHWVKQSSLVMKSYKKERKWSRSVMSDSLWPHGLYRLFRPWDFPGKNTGVGCHFLLQRIFPTQGLNPGLLHSRQMLYYLSHPGSPSKEAPFSSNCLKDVLEVIFFLIYMFENSWIFFFFIWLIVWVWIEFWGKKIISLGNLEGIALLSSGIQRGCWESRWSGLILVCIFPVLFLASIYKISSYLQFRKFTML